MSAFIWRLVLVLLLAGAWALYRFAPELLLHGARGGYLNDTYIRVPVKAGTVFYSGDPRRGADSLGQWFQHRDDRNISGLSLTLSWPDLRTLDVEERFRRRPVAGMDARRVEVRVHETMLPIGVGGVPPKTPGYPVKEKPTYQNGYPAAQVAALWFERLPHLSRIGTQYEHRGLDAQLGLLRAEPVGPFIDKPDSFNQDMYWTSEPGAGAALIRCSAGEPGAHYPRDWRRCEHSYHLERPVATVVVYYNKQLLPQWRDLQQKTAEYLRSLSQVHN